MTTRKVAQTILRWTARIIGALLVGLVVLFAVGEGVRIQDFDVVTGSMMVVFLVALAGMLALGTGGRDDGPGRHGRVLCH